MNFLDIMDLYQPLQKDREEMLKIYNQLLQSCHWQIRNVSQNRQQDCVISVPHFVAGAPPFDFGKVMTYLIQQLSRNGLLVVPVTDDQLYISWKPEDINYQRYRASREEHQRYLQMEETQRLKQERERRALIETELKEYDEPVRKNRKINSGLDHVAMIEFDEHVNDLIPVNRHKLRALKEYPKRELKRFRGPT